MSREVRRANKKVNWQIGETWWGYLLDPVPCQHCTGEECPMCDGTGKAYPEVEPPAYELDKFPSYYANDEHYGWQMWQTVSEGGPISPVCDSPEELARWLADNKASAGGYSTATYEQWLAMIRVGWAPSLVVDSHRGVLTGVEAIGEKP